jgi:hypothetical protein
MKSLAVVLGGLAVAGMFITTIALYPPHERNITTVVSTGPTVERLERLSHLATMRVLVAGVLIGDGDGFRGSWLVKGDGLLGVNLSRASIVEKDGRTMTRRVPGRSRKRAGLPGEETRTSCGIK